MANPSFISCIVNIILYTCFRVGTFCLDPENVILQQVCGILILLTGSLWFLYYFLRASVNPSDYRGFQHPETDFQKILQNRQNWKSRGGRGAHIEDEYLEKLNVSDIKSSKSNEMDLTDLSIINKSK